MTTFFSKPYPVPIHYREKVGKEINKMIKLGIIKPSKSNYINSRLIVKKTEKPFMSSLDLTSNEGQIGLSEKCKQYNASRILNRVMEFIITIYLFITNQKGIRSLLDLVKCYARLVNDYAKLTITCLKLIRKHVRFKREEYNSLASHSLREKSIFG